jgi:hypothetical protein
MPASDFPNSPSGYDFGLTAALNKHPAFEYGGNLFAFVTQVEVLNAASPEQDYRCHAMMSTDGGATWVEQDPSNAPGDSSGTLIPNFSNNNTDCGVQGPQYSVAVDGSTALIFSVQLGTTFIPPTTRIPTNVGQNQLIKFDLINLLWDNSYITPTRVVDIQRNGTNPTVAPGGAGTTYAQLIVIGANDYVLFFSSLSEVVGGTLAYARMSYARFDGTTMGTPVVIPDQTATIGFNLNYYPIDAVLDENGLIHFFYQHDPGYSGNIPTVHHVALDTNSWTFGTTQGILSTLNYWADEYNAVASTASKAIVYTPSGGTQQVAICFENTSADFSSQTLSFFYADATATPTWNQVDITTGVDVTSGLSGESAIILFPIPQVLGGTGQGSVSISEQGGTILVAWNNSVGDIPDRIGSVIYSTAPSDTLVFTTPSVLFTTGPIVSGEGDNNVVGVDTFPITGGFGVLASTVDLQGSGGEVMQFYLLPVSTELTLACPIDGGTATVGVPYSAQLVASGGTEPYTFSILSGALPDGLTLDTATGIISGTPTLAGTFDYVAEVTDADMNTADTDPGCEIIVSEPPSEVTVACPVAGGTATTSVPYNSGAPPVSGGTPPYFFTLVSGTLPTGFTLDPFTGIISGTTEQEGIFSYTLEVQDSSSPPQFSEVPEPCTIVVSINQGCRFRLLKIMPTFGPAKKLPVRGSVE